MRLTSSAAPLRDPDAELAAIDALPRVPTIGSVLIPAVVLYAFALGWFFAALVKGGMP